MHCSGLAWHPDVATQMVLASEDDRLPVVQMWDLRFATSPLRVLENHARYGAPLPRNLIYLFLKTCLLTTMNSQIIFIKFGNLLCLYLVKVSMDVFCFKQ